MTLTKQGRFPSYAVGACMLAALGGCGDDNVSSNRNGPREDQESRDDQGSYRATLTAVNGSVAGNPTGTAAFNVQGDIVTATVNMNGTPVNITHMQHINSLSACPTASNDTNKDGFVDVIEGGASYGPTLVPLDGDLESQSGGMDMFPMADQNGNYAYSRSASLSRILADLLDTDGDLADTIIKLSPGDLVNFAGRTVVIYGVPETTVTLPASVQTISGATRHATLPIACGKIERISASASAMTAEALMQQQQQQQQQNQQQQQDQQQQDDLQQSDTSTGETPDDNSGTPTEDSTGDATTQLPQTTVPTEFDETAELEE
ncbi:MAG TPA: hypothetical protein VNJ01_02400 [Bacteriovoracaceae bacterium]|nr:hypothetical protein [Bacteriovoracaceae bacterium]